MDTHEIATKADIEVLLGEIKNLQKLFSGSGSERKILRSSDVREILNISDGTLQKLRVNNSLPCQKINGTWFYKSEDVFKMFNNEN